MKEIKPDEVINTFLKASLDCIKDESLDINLSACATIPSGASDHDPCSDFLILENDMDLTLTDNYLKNETRKNRRKSNTPKKTSIVNENEKYMFDNKYIEKNEPKLELKCEFCTSFFEFWEDLVAHEESHKISFKCSECEKDFLSENDLKTHVKTHKTGTRKDAVMECPDCGKRLKLSSMSMHRKIHSDSKRFSCDICGQKFVQKINLTHHTKIHTGEKPFECPECHKTFPERSHMMRHQRYHVPTRPYKCEKCGKMYKTERCLKVHNLVHLDQRPFVCGECNKSFISSSKLKQHSNIHTGERPYKCKYCSRDFTNFPNWLKHTRRRHNVDHKTGESLQNIPKYTKKSNPSATQSKPKKSVSKDSQICVKTETNNLSEIHSLSITSAEELIMEQALEMEEAGLILRNDSYDNTNNHRDLYYINELGIQNPTIYDSSPFSSPASDFQQYMPLPPITVVHANNFLNTNNPTLLPSVETLFASSLQKAHSTICTTENNNYF